MFNPFKTCSGAAWHLHAFGEITGKIFNLDDDQESHLWLASSSSVSLTGLLVGKERKCLVKAMFHIYQS